MTKQDSHYSDLSLPASDFLTWRVMRAKRRFQNQQKREIVLSRPRERDHHHDVP